MSELRSDQADSADTYESSNRHPGSVLVQLLELAKVYGPGELPWPIAEAMLAWPSYPFHMLAKVVLIARFLVPVYLCERCVTCATAENTLRALRAHRCSRRRKKRPAAQDDAKSKFWYVIKSFK